MRFLAIIIAGSLGYAVLQAGTKFILASGLVAFGWLALTRPLQTIAAITMLTAYGLLLAYPVPGMAILGGLLVLSLIKERKAKS